MYVWYVFGSLTHLFILIFFFLRFVLNYDNKKWRDTRTTCAVVKKKMWWRQFSFEFHDDREVTLATGMKNTVIEKRKVWRRKNRCLIINYFSENQVTIVAKQKRFKKKRKNRFACVIYTDKVIDDRNKFIEKRVFVLNCKMAWYFMVLIEKIKVESFPIARNRLCITNNVRQWWRRFIVNILYATHSHIHTQTLGHHSAARHWLILIHFSFLFIIFL